MFDNTNLVIDTYSQEVVEQAKKNLDTKGFDGQPKSRKKTNTGKLKNSLGYEIKKTETGLIVEFISSENYAAIVEQGVGGSDSSVEGYFGGTKDSFKFSGAYAMAKIGAIDRWAIQRNIQGTRGQDGRFQKRKSIVRAIATRVYQRGIKPVRFFSLAMNEAFEQLPEKLQTALVMDLEDILYNDFTKAGYKVTLTN